MFVKLQQQSNAAIRVKDPSMGRQGKSVLGVAMFYLDKNNLLVGSPIELQKLLGLSKSDFEIGMKQLKAADLVRKFSKREYMINPLLVYYGDERHLYILKYKWDTQTTLGLRK